VARERGAACSLQAEHLVAHVAIAQHGGAACIGRDRAADLAAAFGGKADGEEQARLRRPLLQGLQDDAGFDDGDGVGGVERAHAIHAAELHDDRLPALIGNAAIDQPGIAALRDERHAMAPAPVDDLRDLVHAGGPHHRAGYAVPPAAPVLAIGRDRLGGGEDMLRTDHGFEFGKEVGRRGGRQSALRDRGVWNR
jgi:hypothetical protein